MRVLLIALTALAVWGCAPKAVPVVTTPVITPPPVVVLPPYTVKTLRGDVIPDVSPRS